MVMFFSTWSDRRGFQLVSQANCFRRLNERSNTFGEQSCVEWFSERFAEHRTVETGSVVIVTQKTDQNCFVEFCIPDEGSEQ